MNGSIRAMAATGDQIDVTARKTSRRSDPDEVKIEVVPSEDGVTICAVYPDPAAGATREQLRARR